MDIEQRLAQRREQYKAKRKWESSADRQCRLANRREYDRQRYAALTIEQRYNSSQRRMERRLRADDSRQQKYPNDSNHLVVRGKSTPYDNDVVDHETPSPPCDHVLRSIKLHHHHMIMTLQIIKPHHHHMIIMLWM